MHLIRVNPVKADRPDCSDLGGPGGSSVSQWVPLLKVHHTSWKGTCPWITANLRMCGAQFHLKLKEKNNNRSQQFGAVGLKEGSPKSMWAAFCFCSVKHPKRVVWTGDISGPFWFRNNTGELTLIWAIHSGHKIPRASWPREQVSWGVKNMHLCLQPQGNDTNGILWKGQAEPGEWAIRTSYCGLSVGAQKLPF